jgi:hypothetical protein
MNKLQQERETMKFRAFMLKSLPYILSILGGVAVYILFVVNMHDDMDFANLMSNVAASLLAIPLIFILYDYVNMKMSSSLNAQMEESLIFDVNSLLLKVIKELRTMLMPGQRISWGMLEKMLRMRDTDIARRVKKIKPADIATLRNHKRAMNELSYKLVRSGIMPDRQIQLVLNMTKTMAHVVNEYEYRGNAPRLAKNFEALLDAIDDWFDSIERDQLARHEQFQLSIEQENK